MMQIIADKDMYVCKFKYDPGRVNMLKNLIPYGARKWEKDRGVWLVNGSYHDQLQMVFPEVKVPEILQDQMSERVTFRILYVGKTKERGGGNRSAMGFTGVSWNVVFPEKVLRIWFEGFDDLTDATTLYGLLGIQRNAKDDEIKSGYRRMVKQWHPDVCTEPKANEMFLKIRDAYDILSNESKRARYDIGLAFTVPSTDTGSGYRPMLRCGNVTCDGIWSMDRFNVEKIVDWQDIVEEGRTLVTSWVMGEDQPRERWV